MKHTPGPWVYYERNGFVLTKESGDFVAQLWNRYGDCESQKKFEANARLIAASPELFEILKAVVMNWSILNDEHFSGPCEKLKRIAEETLEKAEGTPPDAQEK